MQKTNNIFIKAAAAILATIFATGCVFEKENPSATRDYKNVLVQIGVSTSGDVQTKVADSTPAGNENAVATLETAVKTLRVYAYIGGQLCGYLYTNKVDTENDALLMDMRLPNAATATVDFVAIANEGGMTVPEGVNLNYTVGRGADGTLVLTGNASIDDLEQITYTLANQSFTNGVPMYATGQATLNLKDVGKQNTATGHTGHFILNDEINIELTRSLAKIAVYAAEEGTSANNNVKINSVTFANVINSGYLLENTSYPDVDAQDVVLSNTQVTVDKKLNRADTDFANKRKNPANFTPVSNPYYISENPEGKKLVVNYTTGSGAPKNAEIEMPAIARNTFYKVLCLVKANGEMTLELVVAEWEEEEQVIAFEDNVTLETGSKWTGDIIVDTSDKTGKSYKFKTANDNQIATFEFTLKTPVGGTWHAILDGDIQSFSFSDVTVYDEDENSTSTTYTDRSSISGNITGTKISFSIKTLENRTIGSPSKEVTVRMVAVSKYGRSLSVDGTEAKLIQVYNN